MVNLVAGLESMIKVLFFANLRDFAQTDSIQVDSSQINDIRSLVSALGEVLPSALIDALADESAMVSVDHRYAGWEAELHDGAEVGFLPPVSGG